METELQLATGYIETFAGNGKARSTGDGKRAVKSGIPLPHHAALDKTERITLSAAAVLFAAGFGQPVFLLVAAGAGYRVFTKDIPAAPNHAVTAYYLLVLAALGFLIGLAPTPSVHS